MCSCLLLRHIEPRKHVRYTINASRCSASWQHKQLSSFSSCVIVVHGYPRGSLLLPFIHAVVSSTERGHGTPLHRGFPLPVCEAQTLTEETDSQFNNSFCALLGDLKPADRHTHTNTQTHTQMCTNAHSYMWGTEWGQAPDRSCTQVRS